MNTERWTEFWRAHGHSAVDADEHVQVLRTFNKQPITKELWQSTLTYLDQLFQVGTDDDFLDLCCGNGLLTNHFALHSRHATAVDISPDLIASLNRCGLQNVTTQCSDIREIEFAEGAFSRILLYAGIQYLTEGEVVQLFRKIFRWLRPGGLIFIGDIPDRSRIWDFYNSPERRTLYFENQVINEDVVGTWFDVSWLLNLAESTGFQGAEEIRQSPDLIYAHFRFDMKVQR